MGQLRYGSGSDTSFTLDDADLAHLSAVVAAKLRRREPFLLTLLSDDSRESIWVHESSTLAFRYDHVEPVELERGRLEGMVQETNKPSGLALRCDSRSESPVTALASAA